MRFYKYVTLLLCLTVCLSACSAGGSIKTPPAETAQPPESTDRAGDETEPDTIAFPETDGEQTDLPPVDESPDTYTVPLRLEIDGVVQWEYAYAPDGLSLSKTDYTEETPITYTVIFDENGAPLRTEWTVAVNDERSEAWRDDYYLDEAGRIVDEKRYCEGEIQNAYTYTYEESGAIATQESRDVFQRNTFYRLIYDEMGTHVATRYKNYLGEAGYHMQEKTCTYDEKGRIVTESSPTVQREYVYMEKDDVLVGKRVVNTVGEYKWSYTYSYTYEDGRLLREDCSFEERLSDTKFYTETEFAHYARVQEWVFRERLP